MGNDQPDMEAIAAEPTSEDQYLATLTQQIRALAVSRRGDALALLHLLRALEALHREIQDTHFQAVLPTNRQALYGLLRDIEVSGGWPYINRMRLRDLLQRLEVTAPQSDGLTHGEGAAGPPRDR